MFRVILFTNLLLLVISISITTPKVFARGGGKDITNKVLSAGETKKGLDRESMQRENQRSGIHHGRINVGPNTSIGGSIEKGGFNINVRQSMK